MIYWLTGQAGAGKTTLALELIQHLGSDCFHIDGDHLREMFQNKDYSEIGRRINVQRAQDIACYLTTQGKDVVVSLVTPYRDQREALKSVTDVTEIYVHTTELRGKEMYHVQDYEPPLENYLNIDTTDVSVNESLQTIIKHLQKWH